MTAITTSQQSYPAAASPWQVPLEVASTPKMRRYAGAIRAAAAACRAMEEERGIPPEDGVTGMLEYLAAAAEFEVHGPAEEREHSRRGRRSESLAY
ncbi:MAG TPA: hypothetical protein VKT32_09595 [Chthonomonadaceae bacterium]|nr:hypothetical protein [Chthonomonadaceae bacterium]